MEGDEPYLGKSDVKIKYLHHDHSYCKVSTDDEDANYSNRP